MGRDGTWSFLCDLGFRGRRRGGGQEQGDGKEQSGVGWSAVHSVFCTQLRTTSATFRADMSAKYRSPPQRCFVASSPPPPLSSPSSSSESNSLTRLLCSLSSIFFFQAAGDFLASALELSKEAHNLYGSGDGTDHNGAPSAEVSSSAPDAAVDTSTG